MKTKVNRQTGIKGMEGKDRRKELLCVCVCEREKELVRQKPINRQKE